MKKYRYFLFDLDGTLTDSGEGVLKCVQYALESFGIHVEDWHTLHRFMGPPLVDSFRDYFGFDEAQCRKATEKYRERYNDTGIWENYVYDGIPEVLQAVKEAGGTILVATSKPEVMARRVLDHFDLTKYFDEIVGSELNGTRDQKKDVIEEGFRRIGVTGDERQYALMIGDRLHDVRGAKACGIDCLGTYTGYAEPGELETEGADYIVHSMKEMKDVLLTLMDSNL